MSVPFLPGVHSIPALHSSPIERFYWREDQSLRDAWNYVRGKEEPNFPVPSTIAYADIMRDQVIVWNTDYTPFAGTLLADADFPRGL